MPDVGNTPRLRPVRGRVPAALSATGKDVPPSPDVAEASLAGVIGQSVALHLADLLGTFLAEAMLRDGCIVCAARVKRAVHAWEVDAANARAAAEPEPAQPDVGVTQSFTEGARGPVCWSCFDPEQDGPFDVADLMPAATD